MAFLESKNVIIRGISACVPKNTEENRDLPFYRPGEAEPVIIATGIERRHVAPDGMTAVDMCVKAAETLLDSLLWDRDSIDLVAFVTQTPDYLNQPNSFVCHDRLNLSEHTMCLDFFHGCPGWVMSLSAVLPLIQTGHIKRVLLLAGDTVSKDQDASNREERPLFGDAGTVTALEYSEGAPSFYFNIGTDSKAGYATTHFEGGYRNPYTIESLSKVLDRRAGLLPPGVESDKMDSMDVFSFAITKIPKSIKKLVAEFNLNINSIDNLILHQANKMIIEAIAKRLKVPMEKVPLGLRNYGNTVCASIPLTIVTELQNKVEMLPQKNLICGFGTGLSWGAAYFETDRIICPPIIEI